MKIFMWFSVIFLVTTCNSADRLRRSFLNNEVVLLNFNNEQLPIQDPNQSNVIPQNNFNTIPGSGVELGRSASSVNYQNQQFQEVEQHPQLLGNNQQVEQTQLVQTQIQRFLPNSQQINVGYPLDLARFQQTSPRINMNQQEIRKSSATPEQQPATGRSIHDSISESIQTGNRILNGEFVLSQSPQPQLRVQQQPGPETQKSPTTKTTLQIPHIRTITKEVPVIVPQPYQVTITKEVPVPKPYPVEVIREVKVPVHIRVPVEVPKPYEVKVPHPVPVPVTVKVPIEIPKPYPVTVTKTVHVPVEKIVYVQVPHPIKVPVPEPYPVPVPQPIQVNVPTPVAINDNGPVPIDNPTPINTVNNEETVDDESVIVEARTNQQDRGTTTRTNQAPQLNNKVQDSTNPQVRLFQPNNQQENLQRIAQNVVPVGSTTPHQQLLRSNGIIGQDNVRLGQVQQNYLPQNPRFLQVPSILQVAPVAYAQQQIWSTAT